MGFDHRTYTGLGKQTLGGHKQNLVPTRTREKGAGTPQGTDPGLPVGVSRSPWRRRGSAVYCCRVGGTECSSACLGPLEGGGQYLHYLHLSLVSGQTTGKEYSPTHQQKIGPIRTGPSFPTVGLSQQEASINLLSLSVKGACRMKTTVTGNLSN